MENAVAFFEIPVNDFNRAVKFHEMVLGVKLSVMCDCESEKMAFFPEENGQCPGAISWVRSAPFCLQKTAY